MSDTLWEYRNWEATYDGEPYFLSWELNLTENYIYNMYLHTMSVNGEFLDYILDEDYTKEDHFIDFFNGVQVRIPKKFDHWEKIRELDSLILIKN